MAKKNQQESASQQSNSFIKGLNKDADPLFVAEGMWTHARNAVNNTVEGDLGTLSNEESNSLCSQVGSTMGAPNVYIIGALHLFSDKWIIFSVGYNTLDTVPINSEIGLFESDLCKYRPVVQDKCLNFNKLKLITGATKLKDDCTWQVYWADDLNPDRYMNIGDPKTWPPDNYVWLGAGAATINYYGDGSGIKLLWPGVTWEQICTDAFGAIQTAPDVWPPGAPVGCVICDNINKLDCDAIRLASLVKTPCLDLNKSQQQGVLENGSYAISAAYTINRQRVTNYFSAGYTQPIWNELNAKGSFEISVEADSEHFDEFELVLIRFIDQNLSVKRIGYYSTRTTQIILDQVRETKETVSAEDLLLLNPVFEKSAQMSEVNSYLLRIGPTTKFDFNYQPLANLIQAEWVSVEYPERYYVDGGKNTSYLRDEVYSFFIRWVYNTGDKSASYHIPGRPPASYTYNGVNYPLDTTGYANVVGEALPGDTRLFQSVNTASVVSATASLLPDGGRVIASGKMGYWQSTEKYPDDKAEIWNSSYYCWTKTTDPAYDLCGKEIRHHKFPDNALTNSTHHFTKNANGDFFIRTMGVQFKNIILPKDNDGNDILNIVGYEILRGSRHGNKSILAKGMINNFRDYNPRGSAAEDGLKGLYANYPFNTIVPYNNQLNNSGALGFNYQYNDPFITSRDNDDNKVNQNVPKDIVSFHSPDTSFINPYLSSSELKIYGSLRGRALQYFIEPNKHPQFKLLGNEIVLFALAGGVIYALLKILGEVKVNYPAGKFDPQYEAKLKIDGGASTNSINGFNGTIPGPIVTPISNINTSINGDNYDQQGQGDPIFLNNEASEYDDVIDAAYDNGLLSSSPSFKAKFNQYISTGGAVQELFFSGSSLESIFADSGENLAKEGKHVTTPAYDKTYPGYQLLGPVITGAINAIAGGGMALLYFVEGANATVDVMYALIRKRQYALELVGHGDYDSFVAPNTQFDRRFIMEDGIFVTDQLQAFPEYQDPANPGVQVKYTINNIKRPKLAVVRTRRSNNTLDGPHFLLDSNGLSIDRSLMTLGHAIRTFNPLAMFSLGVFAPGKVNWSEKGKSRNFINPIASHYAGLKFRIENQYGQLDTVQQVVITPCEQKINFKTSGGANSLAITSYGTSCGIPNFTQKKLFSPVFFGGDTYINRFTEKNIMPFFYEWLYDVPDNIEWNYFLNQMIPEPKFQVNSQPWDISDFNLSNVIGLFTQADYGEGLLPRSYYDLDCIGYNLATNLVITYPGTFSVKKSYFYLAACGARDFFVESEVLVDFRDPGTFPWQQPYNKYNYTDIRAMFDADPQVLSKGNYYAYDYSLSASRFLFNQYFTAGFLQGSTYDPEVAELCYVSYPNRITYSLPQQESSLIDAWRVFLPLNKIDFKSKLSSVKNFAKTGMFITFENDSPLIFQGTDTIQLDDSGTKVTVGDAGLFQQAPQNVVVAEKPYEYGSSQNKYGVVSTPAGLFYISQNQGKIFSYREGLKEISQTGMKWWFSEFLPYKLLEDFPSYPHTDNPVAGIACMASYDNDNSVLFFSKKDYRLREQYKGLVTYSEFNDTFYLVNLSGSATKIKLGNPTYFYDASWTMSYDPKLEFWVSFHDWHPDFYIPSKGTFLTTKKDGIWKHSAFCNDYCNFYGVQYPFEVELPVVTSQMVNTIKSIEYYLECYRRDRDLCIDQFHVLDYNFDRAVVYNSEQISGYLNLNLYPKNDIPLSLQFPKLAPDLVSYDILYAKEEQKYRINQFWDITKNRGEFPIGSSYPPAPGPYLPSPDSTVLLGNYQDQNIWITQPNGYIKNINPVNVDYNKPELQRKKLRGYINFINLTKTNSRNTNMILKIVNTKTQYSPR